MKRHLTTRSAPAWRSLLEATAASWTEPCAGGGRLAAWCGDGMRRRVVCKRWCYAALDKCTARTAHAATRRLGGVGVAAGVGWGEGRRSLAHRTGSGRELRVSSAQA